MSPPDDQFRFDFQFIEPESGYDEWVIERQGAQRELAEKLGLPINRNVEVWLTGNVRLQGRLEVIETPAKDTSMSKTVLRIGRATFTRDEIESCVVAEEE